MTALIYRGHVLRDGHKVCMQDFVPPIPAYPYTCPTVMIIGTSMSAGKTTAARIIIHQLKRVGFKVVGVKLTGAGRYRDILAMGDAGADRILDFVDVGLPSSVCPPEEFRTSVLVTGVATSTSSGVELVEKLTGVKALKLPDPESLPKLMAILKQALAL